MPSEDTEILGFNQYKNFDKAPFIIYADLECLIEKIDGCKNNPENSSTTKLSEHSHHFFEWLQFLILQGNTKICCKEQFENKYVKDKKYQKGYRSM